MVVLPILRGVTGHLPGPVVLMSATAPAKKLRMAASAAVATPEQTASSLKVLDAAQLTPAELQRATARPRIDFASVLNTVITEYPSSTSTLLAATYGTYCE